MSNLCVFGLALVWLCSCGRAADPETKRKDSVRLDSTTVVQSIPLAADNAFPKGFVELKDGFAKDSGTYNPDRTIRRALLAPYLTDDLDTVYPSIYSPLQMIENGAGCFFILKETCFAGGDCANYWLLVFRKNGQIVRHLQLGQLTGEEDEVTWFSYIVIGDSALATKEFDEHIEKGKVDSTMKRISLVL